MKCSLCGQDKPTDKKQRRFTGEFRYGLKPNPANPREAVKCHEEVALVDTVCHRYRQGDSLRAVARWLNGIGLKNRKGGYWHHQSVKRILQREGLL